MMTGISLPVPKGYNPCPVKIKRLTLTAPAIDDVFGTPAGGLDKQFGSVLSLQAQVVYNKKDGTDRTFVGDVEVAEGRLTFTREYLVSASLDPLNAALTLKRGDVITEITGLSVDYKIMEFRPAGHLRGQPNLFMAFFERNEDNQPTVR